MKSFLLILLLLPSFSFSQTDEDGFYTLKEKQHLMDQTKLKLELVEKLKKENEELRNLLKQFMSDIDSLNTLNLTMRNEMEQNGLEAPNPEMSSVAPGQPRNLISSIDASSFDYEENFTLHFDLTVTPNGWVLEVDSTKALTETDDVQLIDDMVKLIKDQVRYNKVALSQNEILPFTLKFVAR